METHPQRLLDFLVLVVLLVHLQVGHTRLALQPG